MDKRTCKRIIKTLKRQNNVLVLEKFLDFIKNYLKEKEYEAYKISKVNQDYYEINIYYPD